MGVSAETGDFLKAAKSALHGSLLSRPFNAMVKTTVTVSSGSPDEVATIGAARACAGRCRLKTQRCIDNDFSTFPFQCANARAGVQPFYVHS